MSPTIDVVAVGGPARVFYPEVGKRLGCDVVFPLHFEVANAVGAATGVVARSMQVTIELNEGGSFVVHGPAGVHLCPTGPEALTLAERLASHGALAAAVSSGAADPSVRCRVTKHHFPGSSDDKMLFSAHIVAEAVGIPALAHQLPIEAV